MSLSLFGRSYYTDQGNKRVLYKEMDDNKRDTIIGIKLCVMSRSYKLEATKSWVFNDRLLLDLWRKRNKS